LVDGTGRDNNQKSDEITGAAYQRQVEEIITGRWE
jgi:hypothetical protein